MVSQNEYTSENSEIYFCEITILTPYYRIMWESNSLYFSYPTLISETIDK